MGVYVMKKDWDDVLSVLKHSRHDWLNMVQLIKGNLALKKYDRIEEIIQEIVIKTQQESKLSNLQIPQFANRVLVMNWEQHNFQLEYEVEGTLLNLSSVDVELTTILSTFTEILNNCSKPFGENHLLLTIDSSLQQDLRVVFDFQGSIHPSDQLKELIESKIPLNEKVELEEFYINNDGIFLTVTLHI